MARDGGDPNAFNAQIAFCIDEGGVVDDADAARARCFYGRSGCGAEIDDGCDFAAGIEQIECRLVAEAIRCCDHRAVTRAHAIQAHQTLSGGGEQDAGAVVVAEDDRLIEAAGCNDRFVRADLVEVGCRRSLRPSHP